MKALIILTAIVLMLTITGCAQKSRYTSSLSEEKNISNATLSKDEKIARAILKLKPDPNILKIPPPYGEKEYDLPSLSEDEKIRRAMLKLKPQDIIKIPPSEEKIGEYDLSFYPKTGTLNCYVDGKIIVTLYIFGDIGNNKGYFLVETKNSIIAYTTIGPDEKFFLKTNNDWQQTSEDEIMKKFEWLGEFIKECKEKMDF